MILHFLYMRYVIEVKALRNKWKNVIDSIDFRDIHRIPYYSAGRYTSFFEVWVARFSLTDFGCNFKMRNIG